MRNETKQTEGGTWIGAREDKRGKDHVDIYDNDPRDIHNESIHIKYNGEKKGTLVTKTGDNPTETTDISCFLTTACMRYMQENFDDNCYELIVLRWFRDNFVSTDDKKYYYDIAPKIVEAIGKEIDSNLIYNYIYDNIVDYCVTQIEQGNYNEAYNRYKYSVQLLEKYYIGSLNKKPKSLIKC